MIIMHNNQDDVGMPGGGGPLPSPTNKHARAIAARAVPAIIVAAALFLPAGAQAVSFMSGGARLAKEVRNLKEMRTEDVVTQGLDYSCGPACIATVMKYHFKDDVNEEDIIKYLILITDLKKVKERKGFSLLDLKRYCQAKGYGAVGYRVDMEGLAALKCPAIVPVNVRGYDHFVVVRGISKGRVFIADPVLGNMTMPVSRFSAIWTGGVAMVVTREGAAEEASKLVPSPDDEVFLHDTNLFQQMASDGALSNIYESGEYK